MKKIIHIQTNHETHWVGDGFLVKSIFNYNELGNHISPFLLMDYAAPTVFPPSSVKKGVGEHPHRGFETVTIVYDGEVEHRDSSGGGGIIRSGDVQWMTAASGLVHEEFHGKEFSKNAGRFEMVQLWVNLPKKFKMTKPRYQGIKASEIPMIKLPEDAGTLRIISGEYDNITGPASTFSPINLWDINFKANTKVEFKVPEGHTCALFVLNGKVETIEGKSIKSAELALFEAMGSDLVLTSTENTKLLLLGGAPLNEPIVGYGPFVMNSMAEIREAISDFQNGKMGSLDRIEGSEN